MRITLYILLVVLILGVIAARYAGLFEKVSVGEGNENGYTVAGLEFMGPYSQVSSTMDEVAETFNKLNIDATWGFGIYYNDPKTTPKEELRSYVGNVVATKDLDKLATLKEAGLKVDTIPSSKMVTTEIPIRSQFSYMTGAMKAYPVMNKYVAEKGYELTFPPYEIYDMSNKRIIYVMQIK